MGYTVEVRDRAYTIVDMAGLTLTPRTWEAQATGGPTVASIDGTGETAALWATSLWLGYHVRIRNDAGTPVWWGIISSTQVRTNGASVTVALDDMRNRINVDYSYTDPDGATQDGETGWAENARSVATYGQWEERVPLADVKADVATTRRNTWLKGTATPAPMVQWNGGEAGVQIECRGYWLLLDNVYYPNALGRTVYDESSNIEHMLGWKLETVWRIGFTRKVGGYRIHDSMAGLYAVTNGTRIDVTGTTFNNASYTVSGVPTKPDADFVQYISDSCFFASADEIYDNHAGFDPFKPGEMLVVEGTADDVGHEDNDGFWFIQGLENAGNLEVFCPGRPILDSAVGQTVTFQQGHSLQVKEGPTDETPSASTCTLQSRGVCVAQPFWIDGGTAWTVNEVMVRVRKIGTPTDPITARIYSGALTPVTMLSEGTVAAADLRTVMEWVTVPLNTPYALQPSTKYWITVSGGTAGTSCYAVGLTDDTESQYAGGPCRIQLLGGSWEDRWGAAASMPFQLWGTSDTCTQVAAMAAYALPDFTTTVRTASGTSQRFYRDGKQRALSEATDMVNTGDSNGNRISVQITPERLVLVGLEPDMDSADTSMCLRYDVLTGELHRADGGPSEPGLLPAGQIVLIDNTETAGGVLAQTRRIFVDRATWDSERNELNLEPKGRIVPWEL